MYLLCNTNSSIYNDLNSSNIMYNVLFQRCSSNAMLTVPACLVLLFHISVEGAPTTRDPMVTFEGGK